MSHRRKLTPPPIKMAASSVDCCAERPRPSCMFRARGALVGGARLASAEISHATQLTAQRPRRDARGISVLATSSHLCVGKDIVLHPPGAPHPRFFYISAPRSTPADERGRPSGLPLLHACGARLPPRWPRSHRAAMLFTPQDAPGRAAARPDPPWRSSAHHLHRCGVPAGARAQDAGSQWQ